MATNLEYMEGLKLDIATFLAEHIHHELEIFWTTDVPRHRREVVPIK